MFKIGVIGDEISQDFQTVVNVAKELNLDSIEIRSVWDKPPQELTESDIDEMKRILDGTERSNRWNRLAVLQVRHR